MRISEFINPTVEWNENTWTGGHFYSGRSPSTFTFRQGSNRRAHTGWDQAAPHGSDLIAPADGRVEFAGWQNGGIGNAVILQHDQCEVDIDLIGPVSLGQIITPWSRHGHMHKVTVKQGQRVSQGDRIGVVGSTGASAGPHNHWSITINRAEYIPWYKNNHLDPEKIILGHSPENYYAHYGYPHVYVNVEGVVRPILRRAQGSSHDQDVEEAQAILRARGYWLTIDGKFGPGTEGVVKSFQADNGLADDGVIGADTWSVLLTTETR